MICPVHVTPPVSCPLNIFRHAVTVTLSCMNLGCHSPPPACLRALCARTAGTTRPLSWAARLRLFAGARAGTTTQGEEAVRTAILEKVLKGGRQPPAELLLRCEPHACISPRPR